MTPERRWTRFVHRRQVCLGRIQIVERHEAQQSSSALLTCVCVCVMCPDHINDAWNLFRDTQGFEVAVGFDLQQTLPQTCGGWLSSNTNVHLHGVLAFAPRAYDLEGMVRN
mmetsp:Transcript_8841/g.22256  ORF Transcript_8841/g.22256 Transcript_8841/m.22256 type:complete len:111 (-) Transcript_8841:602-934(-)